MNSPTELILAPGLLNTGRLWEHQVNHLSDLADITIADTRSDDSLVAMAERLLRDAPPRFAFAGLSMGGYLGFELMRLAPERITKLALLDTAAYPDSPGRLINRRELIEAAKSGDFDRAKEAALPRYLSPERLKDPETVRTTIQMCDDIGPDVYVQQMTAIMNRPDSRPGLPDIQVPTLVICGRQDQGTPVHASEEIASAIPGSRLVVVEDCGHLSTIEQPQAITALLSDWLKYDHLGC